MTQSTLITPARLISGATALLALVFFVFVGRSAQAATCTYTGAGGNNNWNNAANWSGCGGNVPGVGAGAGDDVVFSNAGNVAVNIDTNIDINNFTVNSTYTALIANPVGATWNVSGNWTRLGGTFAGGGSTVILDGTNQTLSGSTTFTNLTKSSSSSTLTFKDGTVQRVVGTLTLSGVNASSRLNIRSTISGIPAYLNLTGATTSLNFLNVKDNYVMKSNTTELDPTNSVNAGNTQLWFTPSPVNTGGIASTIELNGSTTNVPALEDFDYYGEAVANIGDLDLDGVNDIAVGVTGEDTGVAGGGAVFIHFMNANGTVKSTAQINRTTTNGPTDLASGNQYGSSVASIGDLDGDGVQDLAVGAMNDISDGFGGGSVYIHFMNSNGTLDSTVEIRNGTANGPTTASGDSYGVSVANLGDLDGDGVQDLAVGANFDDAGATNRGTVHIHFMNTNGSIDSTVEINGSTANGPTLAESDFYGTAVASIGDLDNDGVNDLAVGAFGAGGNSNTGAVFIHLLNTNGSVKSTATINSSTQNGPIVAPNDTLGTGIANMGDLDGDGVQDLLLASAMISSGGAGAVFISFMNTNGSIDSTLTINGSSTNGPTIATGDNYGYDVASLGDLNADGVADFAVGAPFDNGAGTDRGAVHLHFLSSGYTISGRLYDDEGTGNPITSADQTIRILVNGISRGTDLTDASGDYSVISVPYVSGDVITAFVDDTSRDAVTVTLGATTPANMTGLNLHEDWLVVRHENAGPITNANLDTAHNGDTDITAIYADGGGTSFTSASGKGLIVNTGDTYTPGGSVTLSLTLRILGTFNAGSSTITTSSDWAGDSLGGTFTAGTSTVVFNGTSQLIIGSTTFYNFSKTEGADNSTNERLRFAAGTTTTITGTLTLNGRDSNDLIQIDSLSSGTSFTIAMSGASSAFGTIDFVSIQDNTISAVSGSTVSLPVNPNGGVNVSNTTGWFTTSSNNITVLGGGGGGVASTTPTIVLTKPAIGVLLKAGETAEVFWTIGGSGINFVELSYSRDSGTTKTLIATNLEKTTPYLWAVPATISAGTISLIADGYDSGKSKLASARGSYAIEAATISSDASEPFVEVTTDAENRRVSSGSGQFGLSPVTGLAQEISQLRTGWFVRGFSYSTVYYLDAGKIRRPFWDTNSYFTHASTWNDVVWVSDATLSTLTLGAPMLPKAGSVLLKIQSVPKVYWAEQGTDGSLSLRWVPGEETAIKLFGAQWADYVIDVEPTIFGRYKIGADVAPTEVLDVAGLKTRQALAAQAM